MKQVNLWSFYVIGFQLHKLVNLMESEPQDDRALYNILNDARQALQSLCDNDVQINSSKGAALELIDNIQKVVRNFIVLDVGVKVFTERDSDLSRQYFQSFVDLVAEASRFEIIFANELREMNTFFIPPKGTHQTSELLARAVNNLSPTIRARLSAEAIGDINNAGKCLALEVPTAAGFHILRAVESLMRDYHHKLTGTQLPVKSRNWGAFIKALDKNGSDPKITSFLTHIKTFTGILSFIQKKY